MPLALSRNAVIQLALSCLAFALGFAALSLRRRGAERTTCRLLGAFAFAVGLWGLASGLAEAFAPARDRLLWKTIGSFCAPLAAAILSLLAALRSGGRPGLRLAIVLASGALASIVSIASLSGLFPPSWPELGPWAFLALGAVLAARIVRRGRDDAVPVARDWIIDQMADPFIVLDSRNAVLDANRSARSLLGIPARPAGLRAGGGRAVLREPWKGALAETAADGGPRVISIGDPRDAEGGKRWFELIRQRIDLGSGRGGARIVLIHDVTDIASKGKRLREAVALLDRRYDRAKASEKEMRKLAVRDPLTSLFNRRYLDELLPELAASAGLASGKLSLAMVDMDHFKAVNDGYGHDAGDMVLKGFAAFVSGAIRSTDVAARFGGEEFVIVFPQLGGAAALRKIESLLAAFREKPFSAGGRDFKMTFSAGIAELAPEGEAPESLVKRADEAMYRAKRSGRNRAVLAKAK